MAGRLQRVAASGAIIAHRVDGGSWARCGPLVRDRNAADSGNAKLRIRFFQPFDGDYWVLALPDDYRWVVVGEPSRKFGWVLARRPRIAAPDLAAALARAEALG